MNPDATDLKWLRGLVLIRVYPRSSVACIHDGDLANVRLELLITRVDGRAGLFHIAPS